MLQRFVRPLCLFCCLTLALTLLAACGGSDEEAIPTTVATIAVAPTTTPVPTDTPESPTATPAQASVAVTETESMTTTDIVTSTDVVTTTNTVTTTEAVTTTEGITATNTVSSTQAVSASTATAVTITPGIFFRQPTENAILPITSTVLLSLTGMLVESAGDVKPNSGHLHLLIDSEYVPAGEVIPKDEMYLDMGDGSLQQEISLQPGLHLLRAQYADGAHKALDGEQYRAEVIVRVIDGAPVQSVRFASPTDGATVPPTLTVTMAASGLIIEPASDVHENAGHMHILVDQEFVKPGEVIVNDESHLHFGKGQLTTAITLTPDLHTLRLQYANGAHIALEGKQYEDQISVTVAPDAPAQQVEIVEPKEGGEVTTTVTVKMAASGLIIESAGPILQEDRGHFHLLIDQDFIPAGEAILKDETHLHFGAGQTQTQLTLTPGKHTIRLQMANGAHFAMDGEQYRDEVTLTVK